ncbi:MAG: polysaccharide biosynthesis/export family protein [Bacteroidota bacterium]
MKKIILFFIAAFLVASCATRKDVVYYQDIDDINLSDVDEVNSHPQVQVNDLLNIKVKTLNPVSSIPYNLEMGEGSARQPQRIELLRLTAYLVDDEGNINFPQLGKVNVAGKTTQEVQDLLQEKLSEFLIDPTVVLRLVNFKFTIQGEVNRPGTYDIIEENLTLPQAIGMAGDFSINGRRDNVTLVRHENGERVVKRIDFTKSDWMNTPYYYIRQNDLIYVEPNNPKVKSAGFVSGVGTLLSVVSIMLSAIVIIVR